MQTKTKAKTQWGRTPTRGGFATLAQALPLAFLLSFSFEFTLNSISKKLGLPWRPVTSPKPRRNLNKFGTLHFAPGDMSIHPYPSVHPSNYHFNHPLTFPWSPWSLFAQQKPAKSSQSSPKTFKNPANIHPKSIFKNRFKIDVQMWNGNLGDF